LEKPEGHAWLPACRMHILVGAAQLLMQMPSVPQVDGVLAAYAEHSEPEPEVEGGVGGVGAAQVPVAVLLNRSNEALLGLAVHWVQVVLTLHGVEAEALQAVSVW
jgi:hypothetical protein